MQDRDLYRGKRTDNYNKECVIGHYLSVPCDMIVLTKLQPNGSWYWFDVDSATVGRCTGIKDKNGKLIFEGDILRDTDGTYVEITWGDVGFLCDAGNVASEYWDVCEIVGNIHEPCCV